MLFLLLLAALGWYWFNSLRALEIARKAGKRACDNANVQFLDDTVAGTALALVRDGAGRRVLRRTYRFEFSETGNTDSHFKQPQAASDCHLISRAAMSNRPSSFVYSCPFVDGSSSDRYSQMTSTRPAGG